MPSDLPAGLFYGPAHEWTSLDDDGTVTIGITDFAQGQLGDVQYLDLPTPGNAVSRGTAILELESSKSVSEVYAPVSGVVVEVNQPLVDEPEQLNEDPYGAWLCRIAPSAPAELDDLLTAEQYQERIRG